MSQNSALSRFEKLIGKWELTGRTLDSTIDNITGWNSFEWILGGNFLKSEGEINFKGAVFQSLEIIAYDPKTDTFPSTVYSSMSGEVLPYEWDIQDNILIHSDFGSKYIGEFSADGNTITGGWRPKAGIAGSDENSYDAIMTRIPEKR